MKSLLHSVYVFLAIMFAISAVEAQANNDFIPTNHISMLPVFLVPKDESPPTEEQKELLLKHLKWAQARYREMLKGRDTFTIVAGDPLVLNGQLRGPEYDAMKDHLAQQLVSEVLTYLHLTRLNTPYTIVCILMNSRNGNPSGGAGLLNGGSKSGPGMVEISSYNIFDERAGVNFQSTLQHELGHSFGLPHVDYYGYDMWTNMSIMSYNQKHHTSWLTPSPTPGILIPEDIRTLALNKRVFPNLYFDPNIDVPAGYTLKGVEDEGRELPASVIRVSTPSGEANGSSVARMVTGDKGPIMPSVVSNEVAFDKMTMWQSEKSPSGWVSIILSFPMPVDLTRLDVFSQHSGLYHRAYAAMLSAKIDGKFREVISQKMQSQDISLRFAGTKAQDWVLNLKAGESGIVVVRGLRFFCGEDEIFPRLYKWHARPKN